MKKDPIIKIYKDGKAFVNSIARSWIDSKEICLNFISLTQLKITKPTIDSNKVYSIHSQGNIGVSFEEQFTGMYKLKRINEDEFIATKI